MNTVVDEVLAGEPRYKLTYNDNSVASGVKIDLETAVTTQGTALNKVLFDSIQQDITSLNTTINLTSHTIPTGLICMWSGTVVPNGWKLCNGQNGTPDLRDRFIVGSGNSYTIGDMGGEATHTLTIDEMPAHTHTSYEPSSTSGAGNGNFVHPYTGDSRNATSSTGGGQPHENRPPYYALAYIMKS